MLQTQSVKPQLLELLKALMNIEVFKDFNLVGGTSLALQIGHRFSIDIDLFGDSELDESEISQILSAFGPITLLKKSKNILIYNVNGIKVDFVNYPYPWLNKPLIEENIRMALPADIAAMKLNAIAGRGSKKDFIDLYFLLKSYTFNEVLGFYKSKYTSGSEFMVLKSLTYFEDADAEEMPVMLIKTDWDEVKKCIIEKVLTHLREI